MGRQADFSTYRPLKFGVSSEPLAIVVKYIDASSKDKKHHLVTLERFKDKLDHSLLIKYVLKKHGQYFPESLVSRKFLTNLITKLVSKASNKTKVDFSKKTEPKVDTVRNTKEPTTIGIIQEARYMNPALGSRWGTQDSRKNISSKSPQDPSVREDEELIDDFEDEDTLKSEDLGLNNHRMSQSKLAEEQLPPLFTNKSLSKSKLSNLIDSKKTFEKRTLGDLRDSAPMSDRDKIFEESGTKFPYKKENLPGLNKSASDNFDEFDDFDVDVPRKNPSLKKSTARSKQKADDFDEFDDDFADIESRKSKSKPQSEFDNDFDDIDDGFDEIEDEVEEIKPTKNEKDQKSTADISNFQSKLSDLNFDYKTLDLNKLKDEEVELVKKTMDANFRQLKPGDSGYVYDKSISFHAEQSNDWDD
jgi:hypothetical protein